MARPVTAGDKLWQRAIRENLTQVAPAPWSHARLRPHSRYMIPASGAVSTWPGYHVPWSGSVAQGVSHVNGGLGKGFMMPLPPLSLASAVKVGELRCLLDMA